MTTGPLFTERYSTANARMISSQCPTATVVLPASEWSKQGRKIRKGERALKVFVPKEHKATPTGQEIRNAGSMEAAAGMLAGMLDLRPGFKLGNVFDISQTESVAEWEATTGKTWAPEEWKAARKGKRNGSQSTRHRRLASGSTILASGTVID